MTDQLRELAESLGGRTYFGAILVPVLRMVEFMDLAAKIGSSVTYVECLFISDRGTRPSALLSAVRDEFDAEVGFREFIFSAARDADIEAQAEESVAYFEVGLSGESV